MESTRVEYIFTENFTKTIFYADEEVLEYLKNEEITEHDTDQVTDQDTPQVTPQVLALVKILNGELSRNELQNILHLSDREHFRKEYLEKSIEFGLIEPTIPDKLTSKNQKYRLTEKGKKLQKHLKEQN